MGCFHIVCAAPQGTLDSSLIGPDDFVIAADAGFLHCRQAGVTPNLVVGDFDSMDVGELDGSGCQFVQLPRAKDDTDTLVAVKEALKRGATEVHLHAALGGDFGHELANLHCLLFIERQGVRAFLHGGGQTACLVLPETSPLRIEQPQGTRVSVFSFGGKAEGVFEHGLRWELEDAVLHPGDSIGVSNEVASAIAEVGVSKGVLAVIIG